MYNYYITMLFSYSDHKVLLQLDDNVNLSAEDTTTVSSYKLSKSTHLTGNHSHAYTIKLAVTVPIICDQACDD